MIALTHVCRAWRGVFISRSSLWTELDCVDADKTLTYIERSKSSPINLSLRPYREYDLSPDGPFFQITPNAIGRLKSLFINVAPWDLESVVANHLSHPAPFLERMVVDGNPGAELDNPVLAPMLFDGDLSSLRELYLQSVDTKLPWKNMANLTTFRLAHTSSVSFNQLLDFFENAPLLRQVTLRSSTPTSGAQEGRSVSLPCLKRMDIADSVPSSLLLNHLLIPVGARLTIEADIRPSPMRDLLPRSLDNLMNLSDFTTIQLYDTYLPNLEFSGPNGEVCMAQRTPQLDTTRFLLESLAKFDISKVQRLEVNSCIFLSSDLPYQALLPMEELRTLTLNRCNQLHIFTHALDPSMGSSGVAACPKLEELVLVPRPDVDPFDLNHVIGMAATRALRGAKLRTVRIFDWRPGHEHDLAGILELRKYVWHLEYGPEVGVVDSE